MQPKAVSQPERKTTITLLFMSVFVGYLCVAVLYLVRVPIGLQPDETSHAQYIAYLAEQHRFPVFQGREKGIYEAHQPPLYYLLCVPGYVVGKRISANMVDYAARAVSLLAGLGMVLATWQLAVCLFPHASLPALATTTFVAFLPMHLNVSTAVGNDALAGFLCTLALGVLLGAFPRCTDRKRPLLLGLLTGAALLTKSSCVMLFPLVVVGLLVREGLHLTGIKQCVRSFLIVLVVSLIMSGWWLFRNTLLYGDPFALGAFNEGFKGSPHPSYFLHPDGKVGMSLPVYVLFVLQLTFMTFWGILGEVNQAITRLVVMQQTGQGAGVYVVLMLIFGAVTAMSVVGVIRYIEGAPSCKQALGKMNATHAIRVDPAAFIVLSAGVLLIVAQFVQFNTVYFQAQARYLHPMLAAISCLMVAGVESLAAPKWKRLWLVLLLGGLLISSAYNLTAWLDPPRIPHTSLPLR